MNLILLTNRCLLISVLVFVLRRLYWISWSILQKDKLVSSIGLTLLWDINRWWNWNISKPYFTRTFHPTCFLPTFPTIHGIGTDSIYRIRSTILSLFSWVNLRFLMYLLMNACLLIFKWLFLFFLMLFIYIIFQLRIYWSRRVQRGYSSFFLLIMKIIILAFFIRPCLILNGLFLHLFLS